jgi:hypothetical protein
MTKTRHLILLSLFLFFFLIAWVGAPDCLAQQEVAQAGMNTSQEKDEPEKIIGAPQDIKQNTGILVFVAWMWISVFVLIYFLRLKIKEADRLYRLRFFSAKKD